ncbi:MAG TPA: HupE/UreJ family protein [Thermoanaerobaculia bacterium]|nr:HupE/UreJ family protein [Thermoanaerobaculia bacterium]
MGFSHVRALIVALLAVTAVSAHEIGTTQVNARFLRNHTYEIDVVTGPVSLLSKIEQRRVEPGPDIHARLAARANELREAAEIRFGGVRVQPRVQVLPDDTVRFTGDIPKSAGPFTWRWRLTYSAYALTIGPRQEWLDADARSTPVPLSAEVLPPGRAAVVRQYLALGFTHILPYGLDHILFVLGIFLLSTRLKPVLLQVTAFTLAHSITLGLTIYGLVSVPPRIVEPMIALSIAYVAIENLATAELKPWRVAIVFAFGLLHGMGFAGVLEELGLPRSEFLTALLAFNVGVEAGQLTVIALAFALVSWWARTRPWYRSRFVVPASALIALTGIFWTVQRVWSP